MLDVCGPEYASPPACIREQEVPEEVCQLPSEPPAERNCKPTLRSVDDRIGQYPAHGPFEDVLSRAAAQHQLRRDRGGELDEFVIEQGGPDLERVCHAHPVDLDQDIHGQVTLQILVLHRREPVAVGPGQLFDRGLSRVVSGKLMKELLLEQPFLLFGPE